MPKKTAKKPTTAARRKVPGYKTARAARETTPVTGEPTPEQRLIAAHATGNLALVQQVRAELGLSAPLHRRRDALTRTAKKAAAR